MEFVRVYEMPDCKVISSGVGMFGDENFNRFEEFLNSQPRGPFPRDFLYYEGEYGKNGGFVWIYIYEEGMEVPDGLTLVDFKGGLYAVVTGIDGRSNITEMAEITAFIKTHGFIRDRSRPELGNVITPPSAEKALGYSQMNYYIPIKVKP